jgi:hypothetical protein
MLPGRSLGKADLLRVGEKSILKLSVKQLDSKEVKLGQQSASAVYDFRPVNFTLSVTDQVVETPAPPALIVTEIAPWSSGNSPVVAADWFEVTNVSANPVEITGWRVDDSGPTFATAIALNGITRIAPGESVIFIESSTSAPAATVVANFKSVWFYSCAGAAVGQVGGIGF